MKIKNIINYIVAHAVSNPENPNETHFEYYHWPNPTDSFKLTHNYIYENVLFQELLKAKIAFNQRSIFNESNKSTRDVLVFPCPLQKIETFLNPLEAVHLPHYTDLPESFRGKPNKNEQLDDNGVCYKSYGSGRLNTFMGKDIADKPRTLLSMESILKEVIKYTMPNEDCTKGCSFSYFNYSVLVPGFHEFVRGKPADFLFFIKELEQRNKVISFSHRKYIGGIGPRVVITFNCYKKDLEAHLKPMLEPVPLRIPRPVRKLKPLMPQFGAGVFAMPMPQFGAGAFAMPMPQFGAGAFAMPMLQSVAAPIAQPANIVGMSTDTIKCLTCKSNPIEYILLPCRHTYCATCVPRQGTQCQQHSCNFSGVIELCAILSLPQPLTNEERQQILGRRSMLVTVHPLVAPKVSCSRCSKFSVGYITSCHHIYCESCTPLQGERCLKQGCGKSVLAIYSLHLA